MKQNKYTKENIAISYLEYWLCLTDGDFVGDLNGDLDGDVLRASIMANSLATHKAIFGSSNCLVGGGIGSSSELKRCSVTKQRWLPTFRKLWTLQQIVTINSFHFRTELKSGSLLRVRTKAVLNPVSFLTIYLSLGGANNPTCSQRCIHYMFFGQ